MPSASSPPSAATTNKTSPSMASKTSPASASASSRQDHGSPTKTQPCAPPNYYHLPTFTDGEREIGIESGTLEDRDGEWRLPVSIEDEDITFDGQPLSALYEMEMQMEIWRWQDEEGFKERGRKRHRDKAY